MDVQTVVAFSAAAVAVWAFTCRIMVPQRAAQPRGQARGEAVRDSAAASKPAPPTQVLPKPSPEPARSIPEETKRSLKPNTRRQQGMAPLDLGTGSHVERIDCETLAVWLTKGEQPVLVDLRSEDYKGGTITNARHLPFSKSRTAQEILRILQPEASQKIVFFCMYGKESSPSVAQDFLSACDPSKQLQVCYLYGGFQAWLRYCARADLSSYIADYNPELWVSQDGGLVYRSDVEDPMPNLQRAPSLRHMRMQSSTLRLNLDENHRFQLLDCPTLSSWLESGQSPVVVDVRADDFKGGNIPGAVNIPFASFSTRMGEVHAALREHKGERSNIVVFNCMYGEERSPTCAMKFLTKLTNNGTKVYVLRRGFQEWLNYCLNTNQMTATHIADYTPDKWAKQDKVGMVYKADFPA